MPEISNSNENRILISNIETTFTYTNPNGQIMYMPVVRMKFDLAPAFGVIDFSGVVNIKEMSYSLVSTLGSEPGENDWTSFTRNEIDSMVLNRNLSICWENGVDRNYLKAKQNTSDTSAPSSTTNYITFKLKNFSQFQNIEDVQLYIKMKFEEGGDIESYSHSGEDSIADVEGNKEIIFKTTDNGNDIAIKTSNPYIGNLAEPKQYVNSAGFSVKVSGYTGDAEYFAYRINGGNLSQWNKIQFVSGNNFIELPINLGTEADDGPYSVTIYARDRYYNYSEESSDILSFNTIKVSTPPYDCEISIYGQEGNSRYAGIKINKDGSFIPDREVSVVFFGNSMLPLSCRIYSNDREIAIPSVTTSVVNGELTASVGTISSSIRQAEELDLSDTHCDTGTFLYKDSYGEDKNRPINELKCVLVGPNYNVSSDRSLTAVFTDIAGNETVITKTIKLNNRIFRCAKKNLREESADYSHVVMRENSYGTFDTIAKAAVGTEDDFKRMWNDIYFPETHAPKMNGSDIDLDWAREAYDQYVKAGNKFSYNGDTEFGIFNMSEDSEGKYQPVYDSEKRVTTIWNNSKTYSPYISRNRADMWFKVIDNYGQGDITLEFEHFDMMSTPGDMANATAGGYKGDVVMIYNAENENCLTEVKNSDGTITYPTSGVNTVLMELLAVYSGTPGNVYDFLSGSSVKSNDTTGAFEVTFQCQRICIIVCTDSSKEKSGFKIKAGKKIGLVYSNYDIDETNGELWYHGESDNWGSTDKKIRMFYDYYDSSVAFDYDRGFVVMNVNDMPSNSTITCDYSYYKNKLNYNEEDNSWLKGDENGGNNSSVENYRLYLASDDDFYEYLSPTVYVTPRFSDIDKSGVIYTVNGDTSGKFLDSYWVVDKDRGVLQINRYNDSNPHYYVPFNDDGYPMRITMDYTHHTFHRLSNDGYGNVKFEDKVIVADSTPVYPDATWADIRIVNEGDAILESGRLVFKCRGEVEGDSEEVKKPLDVNRPWDIQEGKKAVTWDRCRVYLSSTYNENYFQFTPSISNLRRTYNAAGGNNASLVVSSSEPYLAPQSALYGRIVWNLAGDTGNNLNNVQYPTDGLTIGRKSWSAEISGKYYVVED